MKHHWTTEEADFVPRPPSSLLAEALADWDLPTGYRQELVYVLHLVSHMEGRMSVLEGPQQKEAEHEHLR